MIYWKMIPTWVWIYTTVAAVMTVAFAVKGVHERLKKQPTYLVTQNHAMAWLVVWMVIGVVALIYLCLQRHLLQGTMARAGLMMFCTPTAPVAVWVTKEFLNLRILVAKRQSKCATFCSCHEAYQYVAEPIGAGRIRLHIVKRCKSRAARLMRMQFWKEDRTSNIGAMGRASLLHALVSQLNVGEEVEIVTPNDRLARGLSSVIRRGFPAGFTAKQAGTKLGVITLLMGWLMGGGWSLALALNNPTLSGIRVLRH